MASRAVHQSFHKCPSQLHTFGHQLTCLAHGDDIQIMLLWLTMLLSTSVQLLYSCPWLPCLLFLKTFACQAACASLENTHVCCSWFAHLCWCALELTCFASRLALTWLLVPFDACVAPSCSFIFSLVPRSETFVAEDIQMIVTVTMRGGSNTVCKSIMVSMEDLECSHPKSMA